jgi:hypothetical protein
VFRAFVAHCHNRTEAVQKATAKHSRPTVTRMESA